MDRWTESHSYMNRAKPRHRSYLRGLRWNCPDKTFLEEGFQKFTNSELSVRI